MEERLVSRFTWGLVADIQAPELETRVAILRKKAEPEHIELADDVVLYLAQAIAQRARARGTLIRLAAKSSLLGQAIDIDFARQEIAAAGAARANETSVEDIQRVVCHHFKLRCDRSALEGSPQERRLRAARRDVSLQAAAEVQLPRARARVRQPRSHDRDERGAEDRGAAASEARCARTSRRSSGSSAASSDG